MALTCFACVQYDGFAQDSQPVGNTIALQPVFWLDGVVPHAIIGLSGQYEALISGATALTSRVTRFGDRSFERSNVKGYAFSFEYRRYTSGAGIGWHFGPFAEMVAYRFTGDAQKAHGSSLRGAFDVGAVGGHKWITDRLVFDLSARAAFSFHSNFAQSMYFYGRDRSEFSSQMLMTVGYLLL